jgi:CO/xanthine dehydrogenase FAD-binding subunit
MKPASFDYHAPATLDEALTLLAEYGPDAKPLAGGQSLIPAMNFRLAMPAVLVDLNRIEALSYINRDHGGLVIGGMTRHRMVERSTLVGELAPLVSAAMPFVAHAAIRSRGTVGGSLAHADPAAELPAVMLALDASITVQGREGSRVVPASDFFTGLFSTALEPGELLVRITIPQPPARSGFGFEEFSRRHGDFALAGVAANVATDADGVCRTARVGLFSLADRPLLSEQATRALVGQRPTPDAIRAAAEGAARDDIDPTSDMHASSRYRRHLAAVLIRRALQRAFNLERASP